VQANSYGPEGGTPGTYSDGTNTVYGSTTYNGTNWIFTRVNAGSAVTTTSGTFTAWNPYASAAQGDMVGRNDLSFGARTNAQANAALAAMIANKPASYPALVLGIISINIPTEATGGSGRTTLNLWNSGYATTYTACATPTSPSCGYLDSISLLQANADSSNPMDVADVALGWWPLRFHAVDGTGTLVSSITNSQTTGIAITAASVTGLQDAILINSTLYVTDGTNFEEMEITAITGTFPNYTATVTRNYNSAAGGSFAFAAGTTVIDFDSEHPGAPAQTIIANAAADWFSTHWQYTINYGNSVARKTFDSIKVQTITGSNPLFDPQWYVGNQHASMSEVADPVVTNHSDWQFNQNLLTNGNIYFTGPSASTASPNSLNFSDGSVLQYNGSALQWNCLYSSCVFQPGSANSVYLGNRYGGTNLWKGLNIQYGGLNLWDSTGTYSLNLTTKSPTANQTISLDAFSGTPIGSCVAGDYAANRTASTSGTAGYLCGPANTWSAIQAGTSGGTTTINGVGCALNGSCTITAVAQGEQTLSAYTSGSFASAISGWNFYPTTGTTIDRMDVTLGGEAAGCTTSPVWSVYDATTSQILASVTIPNNSYGIFSSTTALNTFSSGHNLQLKVTTVDAGCTTQPSGVQTVIQWH
jgi:hypothetical protein